MKKYLPMLFAAMAMVFGIVAVFEAEDVKPSIEILFPKSEQTVHMGEQAVIRWQIHDPPTPQNHWNVYAFLSGCHEAMGNRQIYSGPLNKTPRQIKWTPPQGILDVQKPGYAPDIHWYVVVQLYDETSGHDEELMMAQTCHAAGGDWLVQGSSNEPVVRIEL